MCPFLCNGVREVSGLGRQRKLGEKSHASSFTSMPQICRVKKNQPTAGRRTLSIPPRLQSKLSTWCHKHTHREEGRVNLRCSGDDEDDDVMHATV